MIQFTFRLLEFSTFFLAFFAAYNYALVIKNFNMRDAVILSIVAFLLIVPLKKNLNFEKRWSEDMLWPAVGVNDNTKRVRAEYMLDVQHLNIYQVKLLKIWII